MYIVDFRGYTCVDWGDKFVMELLCGGVTGTLNCDDKFSVSHWRRVGARGAFAWRVWETKTSMDVLESWKIFTGTVLRLSDIYRFKQNQHGRKGKLQSGKTSSKSRLMINSFLTRRSHRSCQMQHLQIEEGSMTQDFALYRCKTTEAVERICPALPTVSILLDNAVKKHQPEQFKYGLKGLFDVMRRHYRCWKPWFLLH